MINVTVLNTVGTSPMVASEMAEYLVRKFRGTNNRINKFTLIFTRDEEVVSGVKALIGALKSHYGWLKIEPLELSIKDVSKLDDFILLLEQIRPAVVESKANGDKIYFNLTGGRKLESMLISSYSPLIGVDSIYNITNKQIRNINELYERNKDIIMSFKDIPLNSHEEFRELSDFYSLHREKLDPIFFPEFSDIDINELFVLHLPRDILAEIYMLIENDRISRDDLEEIYRVPDYRLEAYRESGLIIIDKGSCYRTDLGKALSHYLKQI